jgi:hypothetical protein
MVEDLSAGRKELLEKPLETFIQFMGFFPRRVYKVLHPETTVTVKLNPVGQELSPFTDETTSGGGN